MLLYRTGREARRWRLSGAVHPAAVSEALFFALSVLEYPWKAQVLRTRISYR